MSPSCRNWRASASVLLLIALVLALVLSPSETVAKRKKSSATSTARSRLDDLATLTALDPVLHLSPKNYTRYIAKAPRLYDTVTFFTIDPRQGCAACEEALRVYKHIAHSYQRHWANREGSIDGVSINRIKPSVLLYFDRVNNDNRDMPSAVVAAAAEVARILNTANEISR
jgi:hypothetical protein